MLLNMDVKHRIETCNYCHFAQPFVHYDRIMDVHDFIYLERGSWEIYQDDTPYLLLPGDVLCLEAGRHHYGKIPCPPDTRTIFIHMYKNPGDGDPASATVKLPTLIKASERDLKSQFERIVNIWWRNAPYTELRSSARLELLLCDLMQQTSEPLVVDRWPVNAVHRLIIKNPEINYTLSQIADELSISERSLRYKFSQITGQTVHRYQRDLKLRMAAQLMRDEPWSSLSDIAHTFGFCDEYHFGKEFKRSYGISPGVYKRTTRS